MWAAETGGIVTTYLPSCPLQVGGSGNKDTKLMVYTETWVWRVNVIKGAHLLYLVCGKRWSVLKNTFDKLHLLMLKAEFREKSPWKAIQREHLLCLVTGQQICVLFCVLYENKFLLFYIGNIPSCLVSVPKTLFLTLPISCLICPPGKFFWWNYLFLIHSYSLLLRESHIGRIIFLNIGEEELGDDFSNIFWSLPEIDIIICQ